MSMHVNYTPQHVLPLLSQFEMCGPQKSLLGGRNIPSVRCLVLKATGVSTYLVELLLLLALVGQALADDLLRKLAAHDQLHHRLARVVPHVLVNQVLHHTGVPRQPHRNATQIQKSLQTSLWLCLHTASVPMQQGQTYKDRGVCQTAPTIFFYRAYSVHYTHSISRNRQRMQQCT